MLVSIVIPVWNGISVLSECLKAIFAEADPSLLEVICVDNASEDGSADLIAAHSPQVTLIRQPVNLGFAGGVNAGMEVARGNLFILLNQDCVVQPEWLYHFRQAFIRQPEAGIAGCTILNPDESINHAGASMERPLAYGRHVTELPPEMEVQDVDYVTGAALALRRQVWEQVGPLDEGFYPAYYEESDYCYRARARGWDVVYVPEARVRHLFSSREWLRDPVKHTANQHQSRFRFISKHYDEAETAVFFSAETDAIAGEEHYDQLLGRILAARHTLRVLPEILQQRGQDLDNLPDAKHRRLLSAGFTALLRQAFDRALTWNDPEENTGLPAAAPVDPVQVALQQMMQQIQDMREQEYELLRRIYFRSPDSTEPESPGKRAWRLLVLRPLSFICGRDYLLQSKLNTLHVARMDLLSDQLNVILQHFSQNREQVLQMEQHLRETEQELKLSQQKMGYHLKLLERLTDYDYR